jgi:hypothetical protein
MQGLFLYSLFYLAPRVIVKCFGYKDEDNDGKNFWSTFEYRYTVFALFQKYGI